MLSLTPKLLFAAFLAALLTACGKPEHPVSWDPALNLESQADIQAALKAPWDDPAPLVLSESGEEMVVGNCIEYMHARDQGYEPLNNLVAAYVNDKAATCEVLSELAAARPSEESYLEQFSLDPQAIGELPPQIGFIVSEERADAASTAGKAGQGLGEFEDYSVNDFSANHAELDGDGWAMTIDVVAHGDFNADGVEDLLMKVNYQATEGSYIDTRVFILTRTEKDGRVALVEGQ